MPSIVKHSRIIKLYKKGTSAPNLAALLGIPLQQIYKVLKRQGVQRRSAGEQNRIRFANKPLSFHIPKKLSLKQKQILSAAVMLYLAEGAKTGTTVDFANSSPTLIKVFLTFLRKVCAIDENRLKLYLYCFSNQRPTKLIDFWSKELKIKRRQFTKPYIRSVTKPSSRIMRYGLLHLRYSDKKLLMQILLLGENLTAKFTT